MHAFDAPMHGKHINLRDFSSKYDARPADAAVDDCQGGTRQWNLFARLFPACSAGAMTFVYGQRREATDWGPEAALLHFFLAAFLPIRIYMRLCFPEKLQLVWPCLALHATVMLCAYPYDVEKVSIVVFCGVLVCDGFLVTRCVRARSLAANACTLLLLLNGVLCLLVYSNNSRLAASYYHASFALLCLAFLSF